MELGKLAEKLSDPTLRWYVTRAFGGWVRRQAVTTSNPQLLHVCDEIICLPTRFSEYLYWSSGNGNLVNRIFPNHQEAWDHTNETNPTTTAPYDGLISGVIGYSGYFLAVDLTDGTTKNRVYITKRSYPELQILIFNKGTITVRVNDPPAGFGLSVYTTGTRGAGYTDIGQNQYVVFYKTTQPSIDTTNGVFAQSPLGSSKRWSYEMYALGVSRIGSLGFTLYTGIKAPKDIPDNRGFIPAFDGSYGNRGGINVAGVKGSMPFIGIYDSDPYCSQGTWAEDDTAYTMIVGWAEDENGNPKFVSVSALKYKHTTKKEQRGQILVGVLYDADLDEFFTIRMIKPIVDMYSYGQGGAVIHPFTGETEFLDGRDASVSRAISPADSVLEWTSAAPSTWTYYDAYALMNCYDTPSVCLATVALGIYTDDTGVSIPSDVRQAFAVGGITTLVRRVGLQVKPFMDRALYAGKTYAVLTRQKMFPRTATGTDLLNWAKKKYPYNISSSEWNALLNVLPLSTKIIGIPVGSISVSVSPSSAQPGSTVTVSGQAPNYPNKTARIALVDPDTYTVLASATTTTDSSGNYLANLTLPSDLAIGKTYKVYVVVEY